MTKNESPADRAIRVLIAAASVAGAVVAGPTTVLGIILFVVAGVMLVTAAVGVCPLYRMFGMSTYVAEPAAKDRASATR
jgi:Inner membrane protein YgaP-like, transmembrane domain